MCVSLNNKTPSTPEDRMLGVGRYRCPTIPELHSMILLSQDENRRRAQPVQTKKYSSIYHESTQQLLRVFRPCTDALCGRFLRWVAILLRDGGRQPRTFFLSVASKGVLGSSKYTRRTILFQAKTAITKYLVSQNRPRHK